MSSPLAPETDVLCKLSHANREGSPPQFSFVCRCDQKASHSYFCCGALSLLQVCSGAHPRWNRNLGTGQAVATATASRNAQQVGVIGISQRVVLLVIGEIKKDGRWDTYFMEFDHIINYMLGLAEV